ncbi:restriction endonuclease subunit S [Enterobacter asburiae]
MAPKLRFSEFNKGWQQKKIGDVFTIFSGFAFKSTDATTSGCRWLKIADVGCQVMTPNTPSFLPNHFSNEYHKFLIRKDDYVVALTRPILNGKLKIAIAGKEYDGSLLNQRVGKIVTKNNPKFVYYLLQMESTVSKINNCIAGTDPPNLSTQDIKDMVIFVPTIEEQAKIADFLSSVDEKNTLLNKQYDLLCQYKKGMMQKIFSQEVRFKDVNGEEFPEWDFISAGKLFENSSNKNHKGDLPILAVTQENGVVNRDSINIDIKSSQESINSYKIIDKGDFVISLRSFQGGIEYSPFHGLCSPAYTVLKNVKPIIDGFYRFYLKKDSFIEELSQTVVGIRDGKQISYKAFSILELPYPSLPEQKKISDFLSALDDKIAVKKAELDKLNTWKQGLLQQMFV